MSRTTLAVLVASTVIGAALWATLDGEGQPSNRPAGERTKAPAAERTPAAVLPEVIAERPAASAEPDSPADAADGLETLAAALDSASTSEREALVAALADPSTEPAAPPPMDPTMAAIIATGNPAGVQAFFAERRRERAELMRQEMSWESTDPAWSESVMETFEEAEQIMPQLANMMVSDTDCRETICAVRVELVNSDYEAVAPFMSNIGIVLGTDSWVHHDAEPGAAIVYLGKPDVPLPDLEPISTP